MIIKECFKVEDIKDVLCHPEIYDTISSDECPKLEDFEPPMTEEYCYIVGYVKGEPIGVMVYHDEGGKNFCHVQVIPKYRAKYALEFGERSLMFRGKGDLYATIPNIYKNVLKFAELFGFIIIDKVKSSGFKNGKPFDDYVLKYNRD